MKPSLLIVGNFLSSQGGNLTIVEEMAQYLENAGYSLITTSRIHSRLLRLMDMIHVAVSQRFCYQIAWISVFSGMAFTWAEVLSKVMKVLRKPYILSLHGGELPSFARRYPKRVKRLLQNAAVVTAPSRYLQERMSIYREDIVLIPNPLEIEKYPFRLRSEAKPLLVWLRAFHQIYNPQVAPVVVGSLRYHFATLTLTMIGPDKSDGSLRETVQLVDQLGLQANLKVVLGVPKNLVPAMLKQADIFINTSNVDNMPVSLMEAMACGLCVVSTKVGGIPYLVEHQKDALLVPPNDPEAIVSAVRRILTEPGLAAYLSQNARKKAEQFDWSIVLPQWESLFCKVLNA